VSTSDPTDPQRIAAATGGSGRAAAILAFMVERLGGVDTGRLERSCSRRRDSIRFGAGALGLERAEVYLSSQAYAPHRHDTYAIGVTTAGVQTFRYRGTRRVCLPGQLHVLLARAEVAAVLADTLRSLSGRRDRLPVSLDVRAVELAREYLAAHASEQTPASTLEVVTGADRFTLARHFRRAFGTSPDRYRTMRRLALARAAIERGVPLAQAAAQAGFADQSHMTRQFKRTYGLTPARWSALTAGTLGGARRPT
jgi:AraC-like DNA-binding protein